MTPRRPDFSHVVALTDGYGTFEHASFAVARREHGYCTDDVARVLLVSAREPDPSPIVRQLARGSLAFVAAAQGFDGSARNRRGADGRWHGPRTVEDCWGRAMWALGTAACCSDGSLRQEALAHFEHGTQQHSPWPRAMAFAALGAAAVLDGRPDHDRAAGLLSDAVDVIGTGTFDEAWPWPEPRLTYANAVLPDALIAAGAALGRPELLDHGLHLLGWLLDREAALGHLSVTPVGGSGPGDGPGFDQQPIEVATMAEACARAAHVTGSPRWSHGVEMAAAWFDGANDSCALMWDPSTGGCYDGLHDKGVNRNQGAESTLALIATRQHARMLVTAAV